MRRGDFDACGGYGWGGWVVEFRVMGTLVLLCVTCCLLRNYSESLQLLSS